MLNLKVKPTFYEELIPADILKQLVVLGVGL